MSVLITKEEAHALAMGRLRAVFRGGLMSATEIHRRLDEAGFPVPHMDRLGWCWDSARALWWKYTVIGEVIVTGDTGAAAGRGPCVRAGWGGCYGYGDTGDEALADLRYKVMAPHVADAIATLHAPEFERVEAWYPPPP